MKGTRDRGKDKKQVIASAKKIGVRTTRIIIESLGIITAGFGSIFVGGALPQALGAMLLLAAILIPD